MARTRTGHGPAMTPEGMAPRSGPGAVGSRMVEALAQRGVAVDTTQLARQGWSWGRDGTGAVQVLALDDGAQAAAVSARGPDGGQLTLVPPPGNLLALVEVVVNGQGPWQQVVSWCVEQGHRLTALSDGSAHLLVDGPEGLSWCPVQCCSYGSLVALVLVDAPATLPTATISSQES